MSIGLNGAPTVHTPPLPVLGRILGPVVGVGASAGGIDALLRFFPAVASDTDQSFVVIQHLAPNHKSTLTDLLSRSCSLPVTLVEKETQVLPGHVYVIPPNAVLTIKDGRLRLSKPAAPREQRTPIDSFLISLAQDQGENAACVILSGTGSDGTLGLRSVKEHGGVTLAQTSASAEYDGMMRSAIATGLVDFVLPAENMPTKLAEYFSHLTKTDGDRKNGTSEQATALHLAQIYTLLSTRTGHNFSGYKEKTVLRRMTRRMQLLQIQEVPAFIEHLRKQPTELDLLFQDLLIGVTNFFRDPAAFAALGAHVIPKLFDGKGSDVTIRVWVPGCSTGEEVYSIAILLREQLLKASDGAPKLQIFATDIDDHALETARIGRYSMTISQDITLERLERFFVREDNSYRVVSDLREMCLFSAHNLLRDPPFSKLDLISCRNLMIYLNGQLQSRVIPLFHYALNRDGFLFLGSSENVTRHTRLFATVDKPNRLFKRLSAERKQIDFPLTPSVAQSRPNYRPYRLPAGMDLLESAERQILDRYAPAFVVINSDGEVLQSSGRTGKYLELPAGAPDTNVFGLARRGLRMEMRAVVSKAIKSGQVAVQSDLRIGTDGGQQTLNLIVQPLRTEDAANASYMIIFQDVGEIESQTKSNQILIDVDGASRQLEAELRAIKERLQTTTEELESSNEELKSANEELSSINEELQSSNEELETSKEELQSTNEELHTVNSELSLRVEELGKANSDVRNLLENTQIATIFLDRDLAIKSFTPAAKDVFRLVDSDAGRPITHVRTRFTLDALQEDMEKVLRTLGTIERYVQSTDSNAFYVVRILPYRTVDEVIGGVVLTFTDVTQITIAETKIEDLTRDLRNRFDSLETVVDLVPVGIVILNDSASEPIRVNRAGARLLGDDDSGKGLRPVSVPIRLFDKGRELLPNETPLRQAHESRKTIANFEGRLLRADGSYVSVALSASPLFNKAGEIRGAIAAIADISQRKLAELHQQLLVNELNHRVKNMLATVQAVASQSFRNAGSMAQARGAFEQRLMALSIAHDMLTRENWEAVGLTEIVSGFMAAHCAVDHGQYTADGPEVRISPKSALALSMALHELGTNALKYGALSTKAGHVSILWTVTKPVPDQRLLMSWVETGGPSVAPPKKRGFGTRMIERGLAQDLGGQVILDFAETGIVCTIDAPLELVTMREQLQ